MHTCNPILIIQAHVLILPAFLEPSMNNPCLFSTAVPLFSGKQCMFGGTHPYCHVEESP